MKQEFYSNGKLLLTGEYVVLDGAQALALPVKYGQSLEVEEIAGKHIRWTSFDNDGLVWYEDIFPVEAIAGLHQYENRPETNTLIKILHAASLLNHELLKNEQGFSITTRLTFPRQWGLGSSSTLINNIADWFEIDAYTLLENSFGGSGYDIACAQNATPLLYSLDHGIPIVKPIDFNPAFTDMLYFVYLNKKQNSRDAIEGYRKRGNDRSQIIKRINAATQTALKAANIDAFATALEHHENVMSEVLGLKTVKEQLFPDFAGTLKSLGAWGGDFILAVSDADPSSYFRQKGYAIVIPYSEMILNKKS